MQATIKKRSHLALPKTNFELDGAHRADLVPYAQNGERLRLSLPTASALSFNFERV